MWRGYLTTAIYRDDLLPYVPVVVAQDADLCSVQAGG
jgi:hypothetical protein